MPSEDLEGSAGAMSEAVRRAASVLESELGNSLSGLRRLQEVMTDQRRIDEEAFEDVRRRLSENGRELIAVATNRIGELREDDVQELASNFSTHAQDLFDTAVSLLTMVPDIVNRLAARGEQRVPPEGAPPAKPGPEGAAGAEPKPAKMAAKKAKPAPDVTAEGSGQAEGSGKAERSGRAERDGRAGGGGGKPAEDEHAEKPAKAAKAKKAGKAGKAGKAAKSAKGPFRPTASANPRS